MAVEQLTNHSIQFDGRLLKETFQKIDLQAIFFDLDGTLVSADFAEIAKRRAEGVMLSNLSEDSKKEASKYFKELSTYSLLYRGSTPQRWVEVVSLLGRRFPQIDHKHQKRGLGILLNQHKGSFPPLDGVPGLLAGLKETGIKIGIVTMSEDFDARRKCFNAKIDGFVDSYHCVVNEIKMPDHWRKAALNMGVDCKKSMAIGDSITYDVTASLVAEFKWVVWFNSKNEFSNQFFRLAQIGVNEVRDVQNLYSFLLSVPVS